MSRSFPLFGILFSVLILFGCAGEKRPDGFPKIYPASITVLDDNGPIANVKISLFSKEGNCPWPIGGTTNASGEAELFTYGKFRGAPSGDFIIVLKKSEIEDADQMPKGNDDSGSPKAKPTKTSFRVFALIDPVYSEKGTTPLTMKIEGSGSRETFKLGKPVRKQTGTIRTDTIEE
ncbi:MAG: hypothetical protein Q4G69_08255 [Planctomycetia bacterium]|nr:hypothetical protein [Planctomycetia bacterium]